MSDKQSLGNRLRETIWVPMSDDAKASHLAAIEAALEAAPVRPPTVRRRLVTIAVAAALLILPAGIAVAAEGTLPGDVLYPIKRVTETMRAWIDSDVAAEHRVEELEELVERDAPVAAIEEQLERARIEVDRLSADHELRPRLADAQAAAPAASAGDVVTADGTVDVPPPSITSTVPPADTTVTTAGSTTTTTTTSPDVRPTPGTTIAIDRPPTTVTDSTTVITPPPTIVPPTTTVPTTTFPPEFDRLRVIGYVHAGPTCPVERFPPDPDCADRPVGGAVLLVTTEDGKEMERAESNAEGRFALQLPRGSYVLVPQPVEGLLGTAPEQRFVVGDDVVTLDVAYDTGIR